MNSIVPQSEVIFQIVDVADSEECPLHGMMDFALHRLNGVRGFHHKKYLHAGMAGFYEEEEERKKNR